jgi:uncharacterized protein
MHNFLLARSARLLGGLAAALIISGCAGLGGEYRAGIDAVSLVNAIEQDDVSYVQTLVNRGTININQRIVVPVYSGGAPLIALSARAGSINMLRYLIGAGANVNARTSVNETPLMLAAYFRDEGAMSDRYDQAVRLLVEAGANLENEPHNYTPLAYAAYSDRQRALRYLIERGARVDADARDRLVYINTPLMMAAMQGHREAVRVLLRAGADPLVRVHHGNTAREFAQKYNHTHVEPLLACAETLPPGGRYTQYCEGPNVAATR